MYPWCLVALRIHFVLCLLCVFLFIKYPFGIEVNYLRRYGSAFSCWGEGKMRRWEKDFIVGCRISPSVFPCMGQRD